MHSYQVYQKVSKIDGLATGKTTDNFSIRSSLILHYSSYLGEMYFFVLNNHYDFFQNYRDDTKDNRNQYNSGGHDTYDEMPLVPGN